MNDVNRIAEAFLACTLPKAEWTHEAHLKVGLWHCLRYSADESLNLLRERISKYNISTGVQNTESSGYHETITRFYVWQIGYFLHETAHNRSIDALADELIQRYGEVAFPEAQRYHCCLLHNDSVTVPRPDFCNQLRRENQRS